MEIIIGLHVVSFIVFCLVFCLITIRTNNLVKKSIVEWKNVFD